MTDETTLNPSTDASNAVEQSVPPTTNEMPEVVSAAEANDAMAAELQEFDAFMNDHRYEIVQHEVSSIITVRVVAMRSDHVLVDLGDKAEGVIPLQEFADAKGGVNVAVGQEIEVEVLGRDEETGLIEVSYKQARAQRAWKDVEAAFASGVPLQGVVSRVVKSGVIVDVKGVQCFMPASQIADVRVNNLEEWIGKDVEVVIVDFIAGQKRVVVSRRRLVEANKRRALEEILSRLKASEVVQGTVKSIQNFGAFLDMGGVDAFMPREEISWDRSAAPSSLLEVGQTFDVKVIDMDAEAGRIKVSRKALRSDPWETVASRYPEGTQVQGEVVTITKFGAFVRLEEGLTGLIHVSDLTWKREAVRITDIVKEGDAVSAVVLKADFPNRRLSLGLKQLAEDPWLEAERVCPKGSKVKGTVTSVAPFGAFVRVTDEIEGLIHISEMSWDKKIKDPKEVLQVGQEVEAVVLKTDAATRRISLGMKQLIENPFNAKMREFKVGAIFEAPVARMIPMGAFLTLAADDVVGNIDGFLHVSQMDTERVEKPEHKYKVGDVVRCKITKIEKGKISLSRKALLEDEERDAIRQFRSTPGADNSSIKFGELLQKVQLDSSREA